MLRLVIVVSLCVIGSPLGAKAAFAAQPPPDLSDLPKRISKQCNTPPGWVTVADRNEVRFTPPPSAELGQLKCILAELGKTSGANFGFIGNEADPDAALPSRESYIAEGASASIDSLARSATNEGWEIVRTAKADDGVAFLVLRTPADTRWGAVDAFLQRVWDGDFGAIGLAREPGNPTGFDQVK